MRETWEIRNIHSSKKKPPRKLNIREPHLSTSCGTPLAV
jgi:hypothetical protein